MPEVESSNGSESDANISRAPRLGVKLMIVIVLGLALVAIYANVQKSRRDKIESVTTTLASPGPPAAASASP